MNIIHDSRFDASRKERGQLDAEHRAFLREVNASYPEQLPQTRGADPIGEDVRVAIATLLIGGLVFGIFLYALLAGPVEFGGVR